MTATLNYAISSLIVLFVLTCFYSLRPKLYLKVNKAFILLFVTEFLNILVGLAAAYVNKYCSYYSPAVICNYNILYYAFFILRTFALLYFYSVLFEMSFSSWHKLLTIGMILFVVTEFLILTTAFTRLIFYVAPDGHIVHGDLYNIIFITSESLLIICFCYIANYRKKFTNYELLSAYVPVFVVLFGMAYTFMIKNFQYMNFIFIISIIILLLAFENPDFHIDARTKLFNRVSFVKYITEIINKKSDFQILGFVIKNYSEKRSIFGGNQVDSTLSEIGKFLSIELPSFKCFYSRNGHFLIVSRKKEILGELKNIIESRFKFPWITDSANAYFDIAFIGLTSAPYIKSAESVISCIKLAFEDAELCTEGSLLTIDRKNFEVLERRGKVTKHLNAALKSDGIQLYLQPIIDAKSRRIVSAEALARLEDDELGLIYPAEFINIAEKTGVIEDLGEQMLAKTFDFIKKNEIGKYGIKWINVNLSPVQCQNFELPSKISEIASRFSVPAQSVHLEITEESMIDTNVLNRQMQLLISHGYNFSLDDYGSGFSNIMRVKHLPFNNIKIDMQIVWEHFKSPDTFLQSAITLFTERGLTVTAEGVETKEMADALEAMGCTYLQGYYFSKPVPAQKFLELISK